MSRWDLIPIAASVFAMGVATWSFMEARGVRMRTKALTQRTEMLVMMQKMFDGLLFDLCFSGSRVTCDPPVMNTDLDVFVFVPEGNHTAAVLALFEQGWIATEKDRKYEHDCDRMMSWRKGWRNIILTQHREFFEQTRNATALCKTLNLKKKGDRIAVFRALRA